MYLRGSSHETRLSLLYFITHVWMSICQVMHVFVCRGKSIIKQRKIRISDWFLSWWAPIIYNVGRGIFCIQSSITIFQQYSRLWSKSWLTERNGKKMILVTNRISYLHILYILNIVDDLSFRAFTLQLVQLQSLIFLRT